MDDSFEDPPERPGFAMPGLWLGLSFGIGLLCCAGVGFGIYTSESLGVNATILASFPFGFVMAGLVAAIVTHFVARSGLARALAPVGCGCLGGMTLFALVFAFFVAIFPAL